MKKIIVRALLVMAYAFIALPCAFAIEKSEKKSIKADRFEAGAAGNSNVPPAMKKFEYEHFDLVPNMVLNKSDDGLIEVRFKACNIGNIEFSTFEERTRVSFCYLKNLNVLYCTAEDHHVFMRLDSGACTPEYTTTYRIPIFAGWGSRAPRTGECQAVSKVRVKIYYEGSGDPKSNNYIEQEIPHLIQCVE